MTLSNFKYNLQVVGFVIVVLLYTGVVFAVGRNSNRALSTEAAASPIAQKIPSIASPQNQEETALTSQVLSSFVKLCSNTAHGFEVAYPKDWFTTYNTPQDQCRYFAPYSFVIPDNADDELTPISVKLIPPEEWDVTLAMYENPNEIYSVKSVTNNQTNGRLTRKVVSETTGQSNLQRGFERVAYLIFDDKKPAVVVYNQLTAEEDTSEMEKQVDEIAGSLKFF